MNGRLAFSLNDDGTVTLRCDADAFFANANQIRQLLAADDASEDEGAAELVRAVTRHRERDLSAASMELLAIGYHLTRERGLVDFKRSDLQAASQEREVQSGTLIHLARRGWLERVARGRYRLTQRAIARVESLRARSDAPAPQPVRDEPPLPSIVGLSRFVRAVPTARKWKRVLLVAYFLQEHCAIEEFDRRLLEACFKRVRGLERPGSLAALVSQVLFKSRRLLERGSRRGMYRLTAAALEDLRRNPRIAQADAAHRTTQRAVARTG